MQQIILGIGNIIKVVIRVLLYETVNDTTILPSDNSVYFAFVNEP
jgi:hypothetical protein